MSTESQRVIYKELVQARQIFIYFLITMNIGMVGFIGNYLLNSKVKIESGIIEGLLLLILIGHTLSIGLGLYYLYMAQKALESNFDLLKAKESNPDLVPSKEKVSKKFDTELDCLHKWVIITLCGTIGLFSIVFIIIACL